MNQIIITVEFHSSILRSKLAITTFTQKHHHAWAESMDAILLILPNPKGEVHASYLTASRRLSNTSNSLKVLLRIATLKAHRLKRLQTRCDSSGCIKLEEEKEDIIIQIENVSWDVAASLLNPTMPMFELNQWSYVNEPIFGIEPICDLNAPFLYPVLSDQIL